MPRYEYRAKGSGGEEVTGSRQGVSAASIAQELSASGMVPLKIELAEELAVTKKKVSQGLFGARVNISELIVFSHQMATLTKAGISVVRAMRTLSESAKNPLLGEILLDVAGNLEAGVDIASSLGRHPKTFSDLYVSLVHVGENTGRLDEAFKQIATYLELERETKRRMQAATRYPSFVLGAIGIAIVILNVFVIPTFAKVFEKYSAELPWQTQAILSVSEAFVDYWLVMLALLITAIYSFRQYVQTIEGRYQWDRWKVRIPIIGSIFERVYLARFCQSFAMVSRAGVPLSRGLLIVSKAIGSAYMERKVSEMRNRIESGESITATARHAQLFSPVILQMMAVGEETGAMDQLLDQAAGFYEEEVEYELKGLTDALEPILIIAIAAMVLVMALGVFLPMWDLNSVAR